MVDDLSWISWTMNQMNMYFTSWITNVMCDGCYKSFNSFHKPDYRRLKTLCWFCLGGSLLGNIPIGKLFDNNKKNNVVNGPSVTPCLLSVEAPTTWRPILNLAKFLVNGAYSRRPVDAISCLWQNVVNSSLRTYGNRWVWAWTSWTHASRTPLSSSPCSTSELHWSKLFTTWPCCWLSVWTFVFLVKTSRCLCFYRHLTW